MRMNELEPSRVRRWLLAPVAGAVVALTFAATSMADAPGTWRAAHAMSGARFTPAAALLPDGRLLVAGGQDSNGNGTTTAEIYDPAHDAWIAAHDMDVALGGGEATVLPDGRVLVVGGGNVTTTPVSEVYDPAHDSWTPTANGMQDAHLWGSAVPLPDGRVLVAGGSSFISSAADLYDPATNSFTPAADLPVSLVGAAVAPLPGGRVLVAGGYDNTQHSVDTGFVYWPDAGAGSWHATANALSVSRGQAATATLGSGKVLIAGGATTPDPSTATASGASDLYDPTTNTFTPTGWMGTGRVLPSAATLLDGRVVAAGGLSVTAGAQSLLSSAEIYDPAAGAWSGAGALSEPRAGFPLVRLPDGELLAAGGLGSVDANGMPQAMLASVDRYTPTVAPGAPQAVSATAGNGSALVTWAPPASDGGSAILHYTVTAAPGGATVTTTDTRTAAVVPGLTNGVAYTFTVSAVNARGAGAISAPSNAVTPSAPGARARDGKAPTVKIHGLRARMTLKAFRRGVHLRLDPDEATTFDVSLVGSAHRATIARTYNLTLAKRHTPRSTKTRRVTLEPRKSLLGEARRFHVQLRVVATDRAHNRRTVTKVIRVGAKPPRKHHH